jgi:hypothetical protein
VKDLNILDFMGLILVKLDQLCGFCYVLFYPDQFYSSVLLTAIWKLSKTDGFLVGFLKHKDFSCSYKILVLTIHVVVDKMSVPFIFSIPCIRIKYLQF